MTASKKFRLKSTGEIVDLISERDGKVVLMFNGTRIERPSDIIGTLIVPVSEEEDVETASKKRKCPISPSGGKKNEKSHHKCISPGDTVCLKFIELDRKTVYTISEDNSDVTVKEIICTDEGVIPNDSLLAKALIGEKSGNIVTFRHKERVFVVQVLSFFRKTAGIYQQLREKKDAQKLLDEQRKKDEKAVKIQKKARSIKTGNTVCVEFLDTNEKKAFKIVDAWLLVAPDEVVKPYRPTSYDSKTITEADPDDDTISETSPLAMALLGHTRGETVKYKVADKTIEVRIIAFFDDDTWLKNHKH